MSKIIRRDRKGRFAKRGTYHILRGRLVKIRQPRQPPGGKGVGGVGAPAAGRGPAPPRTRGERTPATAAAPAPTTPFPDYVAAYFALQDQKYGPKIVVDNRPTDRAGAEYTTVFRAMGTFGDLEELRGRSPSILQDDIEEIGAPAAWYSTQGGLLGQANFPGIVPLDILLDRLNDSLQFLGEESPNFDFRTAYPRWEYRYHVVETLGPTDRVITDIRDRRPKRGF